VTIFRRLAGIVILHRSLGVALAADDLDHTARLVGPDVVTDDGVGKTGLVARQKTPVCS
jgi:hypothetical protein